MKKIIKCLVILGICGLILGAMGVAALRIMFPPEKIKQITLEYAQKKLQREVTFESVSFNFIGVTLNNFALSENNSFQQGTFLQAKQLRAKVAFWPLLKKRIQIDTLALDGLNITLVQRKDGSFNFDSLLDSSAQNQPATPEKKESGAEPFILTGKLLSATECNFNYKNEQSGLSAGIDQLNIQIENFDLDNPFAAAISFITRSEDAQGLSVSIPVHITLDVFLAGLDLPKAYARLVQAKASYKQIQLALQGKIENFENPSLTLSGSLAGINHTALKDILPDLPAFSIPKIDLSLQASANLEQSTLHLQQAVLRIMDNMLRADGQLGWGGDKPSYRFKGTMQADLSQIVQMANATEFNPQGTLSASIQATDKNGGKDVAGNLILKNIGALYPPFTLTQTNGTIKITSLDEIACSSLTGLLNGEKFSSSFVYKNIKEIIDLTLNLHLDKLILSAWPQGDSATSDTPQKTSSPEDSNKPETYFNVTSNVSVGAVSIPYFRTDGITLQTSLTNLSEHMKKANGTVSFSLQPGAITDIEKLLKQNKIARIILLPLSVLNSVGQKLNLDLFEQPSSQKNEIAITKGEGHYTFTNGLMTLDTTTFESALTNLNASGTIDFGTDALNMRASATLVTKQTPVVFKITGKLDNPSGKLDVANTVGSVLGGILNYKAAKKEAKEIENTAAQQAQTAEQEAATSVKETAQAAKDAAKALGSLFKKK